MASSSSCSKGGCDLPAGVVRVAGVCKRRCDLGDELPRPAMLEVKKAKGHRTFERVRIAGPGAPAARVGPLGIVGSTEFQKSFRASLVVPPEHASHRAILVQTAAHVELLRKYAAKLDPPLRKPLPEVMGPGAFGDNLFLDGGDSFHSGTVCVGDEYDVLRHSDDADKQETIVVCRLQVVSPRLPCAHIDEALGETFGLRGVRGECARTGFGGFFCRAIQSGTIREGDTVCLSRRLHPSWNLRRIAWLLYGNDAANTRYLKRGVLRSEWQGTQEELEELADIDELGVLEWRDELARMLGRPAPGLRYKKTEPNDDIGSLWPSWRTKSTAAVLAAVSFGLCFQAAPDAFVSGPPGYNDGSGGRYGGWISNEAKSAILAVCLLAGWTVLMQCGVVLGRVLGPAVVWGLLGLLLVMAALFLSVGLYLAPKLLPQIVGYVQAVMTR